MNFGIFFDKIFLMKNSLFKIFLSDFWGYFFRGFSEGTLKVFFLEKISPNEGKIFP